MTSSPIIEKSTANIGSNRDFVLEYRESAKSDTAKRGGVPGREHAKPFS